MLFRSNVGIGTTTPQNELNVIGNVNATGLIYSNNNPVLTSYTETDPIWTSEKANYYLKSNPYAFYNSTSLTSNSQLTNGAGYITSTSLTPYYLKSNPYAFYNSTTLNNNNQLTNGAGYITSYTETDPLAYNGTLAYNSSLANYYLKSNPYSYYNSTTLTSNSQLSNGAGYISSYTETDPIWLSEKANYYLKSNPYGFYNSSNFVISDYYLASNPSGYISSYTETDPLWTSDKPSYVPYTGATSALNVGANNVVTTAGNKICLNQACSRYMEDNSTGVIIVG